jgi:hypothetical protein
MPWRCHEDEQRIARSRARSGAAKGQASANVAIGIAIGCFVLLFHAVTYAKLGPGVLNWPL